MLCSLSGEVFFVFLSFPGSRSRPHVIEHEEEAPAASNVLDQLFRKTKTLPALYWLPLTDEQVITFFAVFLWLCLCVVCLSATMT